LGYSGWSSGQLKEEVDEKSWIITTPDAGNQLLQKRQNKYGNAACNS
jgi:putative AlgH/UPF0301 family transcriptional regulator